MAEDNNVQKIKRWKPMSKRPIGRPKTRWENDVLGDIRNMNVHNWKKMAQNRDSWKKAVEQARTLYRLQRFIRRRRLISTWVRDLTVPMYLGANIIRSTKKEDRKVGTCTSLGTDTRRINVLVGKYKKTACKI